MTNITYQYNYQCNMCGKNSQYAWGWVENLKTNDGVKHYCSSCVREIVKMHANKDIPPKPQECDCICDKCCPLSGPHCGKPPCSRGAQ